MRLGNSTWGENDFNYRENVISALHEMKFSQIRCIGHSALGFCSQFTKTHKLLIYMTKYMISRIQIIKCAYHIYIVRYRHIYDRVIDI